MKKLMLAAVLLCAAASSAQAEDRSQEMLRRLDKDNDQSVSQQEFIDHKNSEFSRFDHDRNGKLSSSELREMSDNSLREMRSDMQKGTRGQLGGQGEGGRMEGWGTSGGMYEGGTESGSR